MASTAKHPRAPKRKSTVVRRSFVLPAKLVEQVSEAAPPEYRGNLNAVVRGALEEYVKSREAAAFAAAMEEMGKDPQIRRVSAELSEAFGNTLLDGMPDDPAW